MKFIQSPISYEQNELALQRTLEDRCSMLDNLIELIVFTPRGTFAADPDFGFEYWNHEYANVNIRDFNNRQNGFGTLNTSMSEVTRRECEDSIRRSLEAYDTTLKQPDVSIEIHTADNEEQSGKMASKFRIVAVVTGMLDEGLGTFRRYRKEISFLVEPTVKRYKI